MYVHSVMDIRPCLFDQALQKSTVFDALVGHIQNHQCIEPRPSKKRGRGGRKRRGGGKTSGILRNSGQLMKFYERYHGPR